MKRRRVKRGRQGANKPVGVVLRPKRAFFRSVIVLILLVVGLAIAAIIFRNGSKKTANNSGMKQPSLVAKTPRTLSELLALKSDELEKVDVGLMNLLCAEGLRGAETLDIAAYSKWLDIMAESVRSETIRHSYRFKEHPAEYRNSKGYFRMLLLFTVLQQDFGIHYNPDRITAVGDFEPNGIFFADSRDIFINGAIEPGRRMGTCASLPVIYLAVGRRLGYPLKLVPTKNHLFIRWEDEHERFNIDGTSVGLNVYNDDRYREWPFHVSEEEMREFGYLKSMTPPEELCAFLAQRGHCLLAAGKLEEGLAAHETALRYAPGNREEQLILAGVKQEIELRRNGLSFLPPEQLERGGIPANIQSPEAETARAVWRAEQLSRQKRGETAGGFGPPGASPIPTDPNPLRQMQNQNENP